MFFLRNYAENEKEKLVPDLLFFKKALYETFYNCVTFL